VKVSPWTSASYDALRREIEEILPKSGRRDDALGRIRSLDCNAGELSSCDAKALQPASVAAGRRVIEQASVDNDVYNLSLAAVLGEVVCGGDGAAVHILRALLNTDRISATTVEAPALVERILSKDCPVSAVLGDDDKAKLRAAAKKHAPPSQPYRKK
jgi:hypothetical protein